MNKWMSSNSLVPLLSSLLLSGCMTVAGAVYQPDRASAQRIPLAVAITDASYVVVNGKADYITFASAFSKPTYHEASLSRFKIARDGKTATATCKWNDADEEITHTLADWLSPGVAYGNGVVAFEDNVLGPIHGDRYVVEVNWGWVPDQIVSFYWRDIDSARRYSDSMIAILAAAGSQFPARFFGSSLLPDNYPSVSTALSDAAVMQSARARQAAFEGHTDEAMSAYNAILATNSGWPAGHYNLAMLDLLEGRYGEAAKEMNVYLALEPSAPNVPQAEKLVSEWLSLDQANHT